MVRNRECRGVPSQELVLIRELGLLMTMGAVLLMRQKSEVLLNAFVLVK